MSIYYKYIFKKTRVSKVEEFFKTFVIIGSLRRVCVRIYGTHFGGNVLCRYVLFCNLPVVILLLLLLCPKGIYRLAVVI